MIIAKGTIIDLMSRSKKPCQSIIRIALMDVCSAFKHQVMRSNPSEVKLDSLVFSKTRHLLRDSYLPYQELSLEEKLKVV